MKKEIVEFPEYSVDDDGKVYKNDVEQLHVYDKITGHVFVKIDTWLITTHIPVYKLVAKYHCENPNNYDAILFKNSIFNDITVSNLEFVPDDYESSEK
jgi:hypothetical protein